mmetsp:Transcript_24439/g.61414  ORF Transcript_24439/g.61414 Transcript_24439/m.61414 type:complete len:94 (-) Transcript_24439:197-478(-)
MSDGGPLLPPEPARAPRPAGRSGVSGRPAPEPPAAKGAPVGGEEPPAGAGEGASAQGAAVVAPIVTGLRGGSASRRSVGGDMLSTNLQQQVLR